MLAIGAPGVTQPSVLGINIAAKVIVWQDVASYFHTLLGWFSASYLSRKEAAVVFLAFSVWQLSEYTWYLEGPDKTDTAAETIGDFVEFGAGVFIAHLLKTRQYAER